MKTEAIEMLKTPLSFVAVAVFCLPLTLVVSCGGGGNGAPNGGTITSSPSGYSIAVAFNTLNGILQSSPLPFTIALKAPGGTPVSNTAIYVIAPQDTSGAGILTQIWITDPSTQTTTGPITITGPYPVYTDVFGAIQIQVAIPLYEGFDYGDTIAFASGNLRVNDTITVTCADAGAICP